jgi:long-chain fatty acid transport protein
VGRLAFIQGTQDRPRGISTLRLAEKLEEYLFVHGGGKYDLTPNIALLAGYLYSGSPVQASTFEPSIPDANVQLFTVGTDLRYKKMKFSIAYGYQKYQKNVKNNSIGDYAANGTYRSDINILGVSVAYAF